ncbi:MAG TPA: D-alanyl-D-alanine carboxypeptidase/D-alanyl-D-alanine-endopeptidase [Roseimicrobium sp.]|nr:D-alanyl-D-alanine carboxypeptidase/D-alanyl-D-alanine-endopeptidase [Roseimicrobium sp.]
MHPFPTGPRRQLLTAFLVCFTALGAIGSPGAETQHIDTATLRSNLGNFLGQERFAQAAWGIEVVSLDSGITVFSTNSLSLMKPASNAKLFTGALALDRLGPQHRIRTSFYAAKPPTKRGTVEGDLVVYGRGDPSLSARFNHGDPEAAVGRLVAALAAAGIKNVRGDLIGDESYFKTPGYGTGWTADDLQYYYGAAVSALSLEDNVIDLEVLPPAISGKPTVIRTRPETAFMTFINHITNAAAGTKRSISISRAPGIDLAYVEGSMLASDKPWKDSVSVSNPARWFVYQLRAAMLKNGIRVRGNIRTLDWHDTVPTPSTNLTEIAFVESEDIGTIVTQMMKPSQNLYAQLLLLQAGRVSGDSAMDSTEDQGITELKHFIERAGISSKQVLLDDGSGLSRSALVTPHAIVDLLRHMDRHPQSSAFRSSLPVAGIDGTLQRRLTSAPALRNITAKTGSLKHVRALSGYVTTAAGERLAFSLILNNFRAEGSRSGQDELDTIAGWLASLSEKSQR